jgi:hypothetical protein
MTSEELREEIAIELENIEMVLRELCVLHEDAKGRDVSVREKTAASVSSVSSPPSGCLPTISTLTPDMPFRRLPPAMA